MKRNYLTALGATALIVFSGITGMAFAKDAVRAQINEYDGGTVVANGAFQTPGTYAMGTLKLHYPVVGYQFPADEIIKTFELCLDLVSGKAKPATAYPAPLYLHQVGTPNLILGMSYDSMTFVDNDDEHCVDIGVTVPASVADDPEYQEDGTELVANLQLSSAPRTHLDTVTTIKVHLTLVHPADYACLRPLHLVSNNGLDANLSADGMALSAHVNNGLNTSHHAQHVVALVNTCAEPQIVDLDTTINENFDLQSTQAVKTTTVNQEFVDIDELLGADLNDTQNFDANGRSMCLHGVTVPGHQTFVVKQHLAMKAGAQFPGSGCNWGTWCSANQTLTGWYYHDFSYAAHEHDSAQGCATKSLSADVEPNQDAIWIPITQVAYTGKDAPEPEYP